MEHAGQRVWVTGGSSGVGAAAAAILTSRGAEVTVLDRVEPADSSHTFVAIDLGDWHRVREVAAGEAPDALICCAGLAPSAPTDLVMKVNFVGTRLFADAVARGMRSGGSVALVASLAAARWQQRVGALEPLLALADPDEAMAWCAANPEIAGDGYATSKEALVIWSLRAAATHAPRGVRVNIVSPGPIETPMMRDFEKAYGKETMDNYPKPLGRPSTPDEQAEALVWLVSSRASYVSGANLAVDGAIGASRV